MGEKAKAGNNRFEVEAKRAKTRAQQGFESASEVKHSRPPPPSYIDAVSVFKSSTSRRLVAD
jgi:hypothetical protein